MLVVWARPIVPQEDDDDDAPAPSGFVGQEVVGGGGGGTCGKARRGGGDLGAGGGGVTTILSGLTRSGMWSGSSWGLGGRGGSPEWWWRWQKEDLVGERRVVDLTGDDDDDDDDDEDDDGDGDGQGPSCCSSSSSSPCARNGFVMSRGRTTVTLLFVLPPLLLLSLPLPRPLFSSPIRRGIVTVVVMEYRLPHQELVVGGPSSSWWWWW